jgi:hypothetical protein
MLTIWFMHSSTKSMRWWTWIGRMPMSAAPMPTPVIASSASGTSKLRSGPNSLCSPSVVPNMPRASSTPWPITKTLGSRAISDRVASNTASP